MHDSTCHVALPQVELLNCAATPIQSCWRRRQASCEAEGRKAAAQRAGRQADAKMRAEEREAANVAGLARAEASNAECRLLEEEALVERAQLEARITPEARVSPRSKSAPLPSLCRSSPLAITLKSRRLAC